MGVTLDLVRIKTKTKPVMLCKIESNRETKNNSEKTYGAYIITSMYVGSSSLDTLVDSILCLSSQSLKTYHNTKSEALALSARESLKNVAKYIVLGIIVITSFVFVYTICFTFVKTYFTPDNSTIYSNVIQILQLFFALIGALVTIFYPFLKIKRRGEE